MRPPVWERVACGRCKTAGPAISQQSRTLPDHSSDKSGVQLLAPSLLSWRQRPEALRLPHQGFSCVCLQESGQKEHSPRPGTKLSGFFYSHGKQITHKHFGINQQQIVISHCPGGWPHCSAGGTSFQLPLGCPGKSRKGPELWLGWGNGRPAHGLCLPWSAQASGLPKDPDLPCLSQSRSRLTWPLSFSVPGVRASHKGVQHLGDKG